jgi:hypothetical protein
LSLSPRRDRRLDDEDESPVEGRVGDLGLVLVDILHDVVMEPALLPREAQDRRQHSLLVLPEVPPVPLEDLRQDEGPGGAASSEEGEEGREAPVHPGVGQEICAGRSPQLNVESGRFPERGEGRRGLAGEEESEGDQGTGEGEGRERQGDPYTGVLRANTTLGLLSAGSEEGRQGEGTRGMDEGTDNRIRRGSLGPKDGVLDLE